MRKLLIVGSGGHGKVVADAAVEMGSWGKISFLDDKFPDLQLVAGLSVIGTIDSAASFLDQYSDLVIGLGNNELRLELIKRCSLIGFNIVNVIHPRSFVSKISQIGQGTVVFAQAVVNPGVKIGTGCIINTSATVDHDCHLADGVHISPGVNLAGEINIGRCSCVGIGSCAKQQISIGNNVIVGAGTVIIKDIPDNVTVVGVPGRIIRKHGI
jgi:sugar O-acyltransferase (sialic acid O-acetyltransferase NeuD family)